MPYLAPACQGLLIVIFLVSATGKLRSARALRELGASLAQTGLVRGDLGMPVGVALAAAEATLVAALLVPATTRLGFGGAAVLMAILSAGVFAVLQRGTVASCRCFGSSTAPLSARHLVRNGLICAVAVAGLLASSEDIPLAGQLTAGLVGAVLSLPLILVDDVFDLWAPARRPQ